MIAYKPSPRLVPRAGVKPNSDTLDEVGVFARSIEDAAFAAAILAGKPAWKELPAQGCAGSAPIIGSTATSQRTLASASMLSALEAAMKKLAHGGARYAELTWPRVFDGLFEAQKTVQVFETARALAAEFVYRRDQLSVRLIDLIESGRATSTQDYVAALQLGRACAAAIDSLFGAADVVLAPSAPGEAPKGIGSTGDPVFNRPWHLLGCPMINVPCGRGDAGLPLGLSVIGRPGDDARTFAAAAWIERALQD